MNVPKCNSARSYACGLACIPHAKRCLQDIKDAKTAVIANKLAMQAVLNSARKNVPVEYTNENEDAIFDAGLSARNKKISVDLTNSYSQEERQSIFDFTGSAYSDIREMQIAGKTKILDNDENYTNKISRDGDILDGVFKNDNYTKYAGTVHRGLALNALQTDTMLDNLRKGNFEEKAISSWSRSLAIADGFAKRNGKTSFIFTKENKSGVSIELNSGIPRELEVIMPRGNKNKVNSIKFSKKHNAYLINLSEA